MITTLMARTAVVSIAVYMTNRVGVWGKTEETDRLLQQITRGLNPLFGLLGRALHLEPTNLSVGELAREYYNQGVKGTFHVIRNLPNYSEDLADGAKMACLDLVDKAKELRQQDAGWWNIARDNAELENLAKPTNPAAGDGPSHEVILIERPGDRDGFAGDGEVALKPRTK
ncbi:MICOS complex subunit MIC13 homolog QIL1 [Drosophila biarmipes]|uniref:MICOS complex subunit MIC13 homolog QIL1 n=1 Tax=Drosophila biarmipes TaxID=125945 RepID=UPI0007E78EB0|nr:MICOS complex subunit MIC13 homolog QIL1 [Drosophila biarmipes]